MEGSLWSLLCASFHWAWSSCRAGIRTVSAFQRVDARPEWEGGVRAKPGGRQHLGHPQTLSALRAETVFADRKLKPAEPPSPLLYTGRGQAWRTALGTWGEVLVPTMEPDLSGGCKLFYRGTEDQRSCRAGHTGSVMTTQGCCQTATVGMAVCTTLFTIVKGQSQVKEPWQVCPAWALGC